MPRRISFRDEVPSFLIVCEGKETERLYFEGFRVGLVRNLDIKGIGKSAVNLVSEAIRLRSEGSYEQAWVVFDIDDCSCEQVGKATRLASRNGFRVAYSNQAFELWFLLHFAYYNTSIDRRQYIEKLTQSLGFKYEKNLSDLYLRLLSRQKTAIQNAKRLLASYDHSDPYNNDPCTTVFQLVEELNRYSRDGRQ